MYFEIQDKQHTFVSQILPREQLMFLIPHHNFVFQIIDVFVFYFFFEKSMLSAGLFVGLTREYNDLLSNSGGQNQLPNLCLISSGILLINVSSETSIKFVNCLDKLGSLRYVHLYRTVIFVIMNFSPTLVKLSLI